MSARSFVHAEQLGSHWTDFCEFDLSIFRNSVETIQVLLKSGKNNGTLHGYRYSFLIISRSILIRMKIFSDKKL